MDVLIATLKKRFDGNMQRHAGVAWSTVQARLDAHPGKLAALQEMEGTGGEPDVVDRPQDVELDQYAGRYPQAGRRTVLRPPL